MQGEFLLTKLAKLEQLGNLGIPGEFLQNLLMVVEQGHGWGGEF